MFSPALMEEVERLSLKQRLALIEYLSHSVRELLDDDEPSHEEILAGIREGLGQALRGEGLPVETLWDETDDE